MKQGGPIPEFTSEQKPTELYKAFTDQKSDTPDFKALSAETVAMPEQRLTKAPQTPLRKTQTETAPITPAATLSATTDDFSTADRSFFETNYAESDTQKPVVTLSEARQPTAAERHVNDADTPLPKKQSSYWGALAACLLLFAALVLAIWFWLGVPPSRQVSSGQSAQPITERTLEFRLPSFGLGKSIDGLEFYDVVAAYRAEKGGSRLILEGEIRNTSAETKTLPLLRAVLFDDSGKPIADWIFDGGKPVLEMGQNMRFHTVLNSPPTAAVNYEVAFTDSQSN